MRKLDHDIEREKIAEVAARLIAEHGARNVTANDIATAMGATRGKVLHYFKKSQDVIDAAFDWANQKGVDYLKGLTLEADHMMPSEDLVSVLLPLEEQTDIEWKVRFACWEHSLSEEQSIAYQHKIGEERIAVLTELFTILQERGILKDHVSPESLAMQIYDMVVGLGVTLLFYPMEERRERCKGIYSYFSNLLNVPLD